MGGGVTKTDLLTSFERLVLKHSGVVPNNLKHFAAIYAELLKECDATPEEKKKLDTAMVDSWINLCTYSIPKSASDNGDATKN